MPGRKINYNAINKTTASNLKYIDSQLIKAGYGYIQRLAILGNIQRESNGNPLAISSNGLWHGIIQWDKDRYRIQSNNSQEELQRQTALLLNELEKKGWSGQTWKDQLAYAQSFKDSSDLKRAVDIFTRRFVRPGDINGEINKRFNFAQLGWQDEEDSEYDLETAKKVLPDNLIQAWRKNPNKNHLPTGYTDKQDNYHYLKSSQHESYPETRDYERKDPETVRAMNRYFKPNNYVSKFPTYTPVTSGLPESIYSFGQDLIYKPLVQKKQSGGLVYRPFINSQEDLDYRDFSLDNYKFPVESVRIYKPEEPVKQEVQEVIVETPTVEGSSLTETKSSQTQPAKTVQQTNTTFNRQTVSKPITQQPAPLIPRGVVEYKVPDLDVGNMQELINLMQDEGISFRITSGNRPGAKTKNGNLSHHGSGNALDITPIKGQTWNDLIGQMKRSKKFVTYMREHGLGILDERSKEMLARTGGTGAHFHIGPDRSALDNFKRLFG